MKFKYVKILDDPVATIEAPLLPHESELQERVPDHDLITASLAALRDSNSVDDFYSKYISDSKGAVRLLSDCAARGRDILHQEEDRFVSFVQSIITLFRSGQANYTNAQERHRAIVSLIEGWVIRVKQRGASEVAARERLVLCTYIYFSYIFHRALRCLERGKINLEGNDYEDASLCLHLSLDTSFYVITADKGLREALCKTTSLLNGLPDSQFHTTLQVAGVTGLTGVE